MINRSSSRVLDSLPPGQIAFTFGQIEDELIALCKVVEDYIRPESIHQLRHLADKLLQIANAQTPMTLSTLVDQPIITKESTQFEPGGKKAATKIHGKLSFTWDVHPLGQANSHPRTRWFALLNSSVQVQLIAVDKLVAVWDFDAGDHLSPGCHFHAKPGWDHLQDLAALKSPLPVPRLPTWLFMPTDCLEFLIGELWQDKWKNCVGQSDPSMTRWKKLSYSRHRQMAKSYQNRYCDVTNMTGWMTLKLWKPKATDLASS